ncbi:MAG: glutamine amidotransferase, partial [Candidatus Afipia apatlaquensis]|nr:glutamine amidotransferase [Candidatus Afipia apatlaquensis]
MLRPDDDRPSGFGLTTCGRFTALPVLIILHGPMSTPGRVGNALRAMGHPLDVRRPVFGDALPETLDHYAGAIMFGGPMSANDNEDFIRREIDWLA